MAAATQGNVHSIHSRQEWDSKLFDATTNGKIVVVDFTASWCGPCKLIAPLFAELSVNYPELLFLKVDVDESRDISTEWDIRAMPTFIFIKDGKAIEKLVGVNKSELERKVKLFAQTAKQETAQN